MLETPQLASRLWTAESLRSANQIKAVLKTDTFEVLTGKSNPDLARAVGNLLGLMVDEPVTVFADGEINTVISHNLRQREVFIIQPTVRAVNVQGNTVRSVNDTLQELQLMLDASKGSSAKEITAVIPYFGYARQDRKNRSRAPISAALVAKQMQNAGASRILTVDLHAEQIMGSVGIPWDNLYSRAVLLPIIEERGTDNLVVVAPDIGGGKRAEAFSHLLGGDGDIAFIHKEREIANQSRAIRVVGEVDGRDVLLVDDIIDTAGTITNAANLLRECGAKKIMVAAPHGLFSGSALERINGSTIDEIFITDTIGQPDIIKNHPKITIVSVAPLLAEAILRIHTGESLGKLIPEINGRKH